MRSRLVPFTLCLYLSLAVLGCTSKPSGDTTGDTSGSGSASSDSSSSGAQDSAPTGGGSTKKAKAHKEAVAEKKREAVVVPAGTSITVSLGSALGSKTSQAGETFTGSVAKDVMVGSDVVVPKGATISGTVTDAKALGKFAGGAVLQVRLDSITLNGSDVPVQSALRTFTAKGKGKRTAVMTGGGAALGGIIGALAGGGKGAAIGAAAGGGAGVGGAALTGNKDIVLPAESDVSFELTQPLELK